MKTLHRFSTRQTARIGLLLGLGAVTLTTLVLPVLAYHGSPVASTVNIHNVHWRHVHVEVRIGNFQNPTQNRVFGSRDLNQNETWPIPTNGEDIFYRRDTDPDHPNGRMTDWYHRPVYNKPGTITENL